MSLTIRSRVRLCLACVASAGFGPCSVDELGTQGYEPVSCAEGTSEAALLDDLAPDSAAEYLELRALPGGHDRRLEQSHGTACATATDVDACEAALRDLKVKSGFFLGDCAQGCSQYFLIHALGDEIEVVTSRADLRSYVAPVDTAGEALLLVSSEGFELSCTDTTSAGTFDVGGTFSVIATRYESCDPPEEWLFDVWVAPDGKLSPGQRKQWHGTDECVEE